MGVLKSAAAGAVILLIVSEAGNPGSAATISQSAVNGAVPAAQAIGVTVRAAAPEAGATARVVIPEIAATAGVALDQAGPLLGQATSAVGGALDGAATPTTAPPAPADEWPAQPETTP